MGTVNKGQGGTGGAPAGRVIETGMRATFIDHTKAPLIPTRLRITTQQANQQFILCDPPTFTFKKASYVTGIVWMGVNETLRNATGEQTYWSDPFSQIKNSWFDQISDTGNGICQDRKCQQRLQRMGSAMFSENNSGTRYLLDNRNANLHGLRGNQNQQRWHWTATVWAWQRGGKSVDQPFVPWQGQCGVPFAGLFMCGNIIFDSSQGHAETARYPMPQF